MSSARWRQFFLGPDVLKQDSRYDIDFRITSGRITYPFLNFNGSIQR